MHIHRIVFLGSGISAVLVLAFVFNFDNLNHFVYFIFFNVFRVFINF